MTARQYKAFKQIVEKIAESEPIVASEMGGDLSCFFCGSHTVKGWENHEVDCIWIRSNKALFRKESNDG